jgi:UDP-N-acetylmuramyl pentapeptide phosphotransferase/UDP-N-acetylglucosamine-1-phosphate transferase/glycosyltransferase involved in cell wall biosynthesis
MNTLELCLVCGLVAGLLALAFVPLVIRFATAFGLLDVPGLRKVHRTPVPRLGGAAIALAALIPFATALAVMRNRWFAPPEDSGTVLTLIFAAACVLAIGLIDDLTQMRAKFKLLALLGSAIMFCGSGGMIHAVTFRGHDLFNFGDFSPVVTILWIVGVTVSINFIDGLDGLAAGISLIAFGVLATGAAVGGVASIVVLATSVMGALAGFLVFNYNPASIFMGDCGSLFLGFTLAASCVVATEKIGTTRGIILPSLALSVPLLDTALTMVRRGILQRQSLFAAERGHIHHRLLETGLIQRHVVLILWAVTLTAAAVALVTFLGSAWATAITASGMALALAILFRSAGSVRARETLLAVRRNRAVRREIQHYQAHFDELRLGFREVRSFEEWWNQVCKSADKLDFAKLNLPLVQRNGNSTVLLWRRADSELAEADSITAEVPISQRRAGQTMRVEVEVTASKYLENTGLRLALFSRLMSEFSLAELRNVPLGNEAAMIRSHSDGTNDYAGAAALDPAIREAAATFANKRIAIVHDFLYTYAGAERVLEQLIELFPKADLFSLFDFLLDTKRGFIHRKPVRTTFLQRMPGARTRHRTYLPLMPLAIEQLDLSSYDLIISSSYMVAKGVLTRPDQLHICYCHTPVRYAWDAQTQRLDGRGLVSMAKSAAARLILHYIRNWDVRSANNVDVFVTNSDFVRRRIQKYYRRSARTVYPPVNTDWFAPGEQKEDFYLTASRLVPYKRIDLIVDAFNKMPERRLFVVGDGPELASLTARAKSNVQIIGFQSSERLRQYMQRARAFVFVAEEDFGIVPVEAQACGTPVIAFGRGGVTESVSHLKTGFLFQEQTVDALVQAVEEFDRLDWDSALIRKNAERFSIGEFRHQFLEIVKAEWAGFLAQRVDLSLTPSAADTDSSDWPQSTDVPAAKSSRKIIGATGQVGI